WNKFAVTAHEAGYADRVGSPPLAELAALDDAGFRARFSGSPIKRIGWPRFLRNVLYAIGNSGDRALATVAAAHLAAEDEAVADAAQWALRRLTD
ncbi:MAG: epoxyqueuosine reductase, partial [Paracoccaceae bacterium]|nr:epoxyqueuosine reductase [Paracoccaceae bacterium]